MFDHALFVNTFQANVQNHQFCKLLPHTMFVQCLFTANIHVYADLPNEFTNHAEKPQPTKELILVYLLQKSSQKFKKTTYKIQHLIVYVILCNFFGILLDEANIFVV